MAGPLRSAQLAPHFVRRLERAGAQRDARLDQPGGACRGRQGRSLLVVLPEAPVKLLRPSHAPRRRGRRVALLARYPDRDRALPQFISNHGMRMVEAMLRASGLEELELRAWDLVAGSVDALVQEVVAFDPDVVGVSAYLWSFPYFIEVARRLKEDDPGRLIVFGGPSA